MKNTLYLIYDGDCILCRNSAQAVKIKKSIGNLEIINARSDHPLVIEAAANKYDLNEGILIKYNDKYYYGRDALNFLALTSSSSDLFNKMNAFVFRSKLLSACFYPLFKLIRNMLLFVQRIPPIISQHQEPLICLLYGAATNNVPDILKKRYSNRPGSKDYLLLNGRMNINISRTFSLLSPFFRLAGALVPYPANNIPVSVELVSDISSDEIIMHRTFHYPDSAPYHFTSRLIHIKDNLLVEKMRFGFSTKLLYSFDNNKIIMSYGGYALHLGKWLIPIPLAFIIGKVYSFEEANTDDSFNMEVKMVHPLLGKIFQYDGNFKIAESH